MLKDNEVKVAVFEISGGTTLVGLDHLVSGKAEDLSKNRMLVEWT